MKSVRQMFKDRQRSENEQFVVVHDGLIYAIERADGEGLAMVQQDYQEEENQHWYPPE